MVWKKGVIGHCNEAQRLVRQPLTGLAVIIERRLAALKHDVDINIAFPLSHRHAPPDVLAKTDVHDIRDVMVFCRIIQRFFQGIVPDRLQGEEAILIIQRVMDEMGADRVAADGRALQTARFIGWLNPDVGKVLVKKQRFDATVADIGDCLVIGLFEHFRIEIAFILKNQFLWKVPKPQPEPVHIARRGIW